MEGIQDIETRDWSIRAVPVDVIRGFRVFAVNNDITVAEALAECFDAYLGEDSDEAA